MFWQNNPPWPMPFQFSSDIAFSRGCLTSAWCSLPFSPGSRWFTKNANCFPKRSKPSGRCRFAFFIPVYFAMVGLKLDLVRGLSLGMMAAFIVGSCLVKILSVSLAARLAGFRGLGMINLAITTNARGGPGIVLASVAFEAGIVSPQFYTTLVAAAVVTSQMAGAWLDYVLRKGWPLLTAGAGIEPAIVSTEESLSTS